MFDHRRCSFILALLLFFSGAGANAQTDRHHYSRIFKTSRPYRIFLPSDYDHSQRRYPVIYFFHGNFGTHEFELDINQHVNENDFIFVAWNGRSVPTDRRPYNIGNNIGMDVRYKEQFKDYFPELVNHIDSTYRTIDDRSSRATVGHSMGGFMSFVLAAEYPQLIGTAVNLKGAPEFFIGYPSNSTLYPLRFMFKNHHAVRLRFHNSTIDELVHLNKEVHQGAKMEKGLDYTYLAYEGGHAYTAGEFGDALNFIVSSFKDPLPKPERWHHAGFYPEFEVWDYEVTSNLDQPGYIDMKGVTTGGMRTITRKWQPDGRLIPGVQIHVKTAPIYKPRTAYTLFDYNETQNTKKVLPLTSDAEGRISFTVNHEGHHLGIYRKNDPAEIVYIDHKVNRKDKFLDHRTENHVRLRLLNRGAAPAKKVKVTMSSTTEGVTISNATLELDNIPPGEVVSLPADFKITAAHSPPSDGSPSFVRFNLTFTDSEGNSWEDEFDAPVFFDVPEFTKIGIDDGNEGVLGGGNYNAIPEPGETISIFESSHPLRLYYDDPYIDDEHLRAQVHPDKWGGDGVTLTSILHISKDCPPGHEIRILACYEEKEWKIIKRNVTWGTLTITVGEEPPYR